MRFSPAFLYVALCSTTAAADPSIQLRTVVSGLSEPLFATHAGDGSDRLFIVEKGGRILVLEDGVLLAGSYLDLSSRVATASEMGLLGLAFHPEFGENGRFFVNYVTESGGPRRTVVAEYQVDPVSSSNANRGSERVVLSIEQPAQNHNGGMLAFGADGYLYIATGDGGGSNDVFGNGQNLSTLLGSILRVDVDRELPYEVPPENPLIGIVGTREEIWAYGLRNPWRFSFDRFTGQLYSADVGQNSWEEVDLILPGSNYGWNRMEGNHCFPPGSACDRSGLALPIAEYSRDEGNSVTGGYVYRGLQQTSLWGSYIFGDYGSGRIWSLTPEAGGGWKRDLLLDTDYRIASFAEDEQGELYVVDYRGLVARIDFGFRQRFAQVAAGSSPAGSLKSRFIFTNGGEETVTGELTLWHRDGRPVPVELNGVVDTRFPFAIPPLSSLTLVTGEGGQGLFVGWADAVADGPFQASILFSVSESSGVLRAEAGLAGSLSKAREIPVFVSRSTGSGLDTGLALANPTESTAELSLSIWQGGAEIAGSSLEIEAGHQSAVFISELFPGLPSDFEGTLRVQSNVGIVATALRTAHGVPLSSLPVAE